MIYIADKAYCMSVTFSGMYNIVVQTQVNILQKLAASAVMIECGGTNFLRNIGTSVPDYAVLYLFVFTILRTSNLTKFGLPPSTVMNLQLIFM